jgi:hypothetical protein
MEISGFFRGIRKISHKKLKKLGRACPSLDFFDFLMVSQKPLLLGISVKNI